MVFKNGLMSTLKSYRCVSLLFKLKMVLNIFCCRMLSTPKPHVVGIAWVVECAEQRRKAEEARFVVSLEHMNVAGTNKVRLLHATRRGRDTDWDVKPTAAQVDASQELLTDGTEDRDVAAFIGLLPHG